MHYRYIRSIASLLMVVVTVIASTPQTVSASQATQEATELIDSYITDQMNKLEIPGVAVGVVRGDEIVYVQGYELDYAETAQVLKMPIGTVKSCLAGARLRLITKLREVENRQYCLHEPT